MPFDPLYLDCRSPYGIQAAVLKGKIHVFAGVTTSDDGTIQTFKGIQIFDEGPRTWSVRYEELWGPTSSDWNECAVGATMIKLAVLVGLFRTLNLSSL